MIVHATAVAVGGGALLIKGPSGSGKSGLAVQMLALGAGLVADDRTVLSRPDQGAPFAEAPEAIRGMIEVRGLGLVDVGTVGRTRLVGVLDMSIVETERFPEERTTEILGFPLPIVYRADSPSFPSALFVWLKTRGPK